MAAQAIVPRCGASLFLHLLGVDGTRLQRLPPDLLGCSVIIAALDQRRYANAVETSGEGAADVPSNVQSVAPLEADACLILRAPDGAFVPTQRP